MRNKKVTIRFNDEEFNLLNNYSENANMTTSQFIRESISNKNVTVVDKSGYIINSLSKISDAINELQNKYSNIDFSDLKKEVDLLWHF